MKHPVLVLAVLVVTASGALAQSTPRTAQPDKLDSWLASWEKKMKEVEALSTALERTDKDKVLKTTSKFSGYALYMKSGKGKDAQNMAVLELNPAGKKELAEKLVCTGQYLFVFAPAQKEIRAYDMPKPKGNEVGDDGFLGLLFGMKAEDARKRYKMTLPTLKHSQTPGEDQYYVYVDIEPRDPKDKADFARARLVLDKKTFLPRQVWFEHANGNEVTWEITRTAVNPKEGLNRRFFDKPATPQGWKFVPVSKESAQKTTKPTVVRPSDK